MGKRNRKRLREAEDPMVALHGVVPSDKLEYEIPFDSAEWMGRRITYGGEQMENLMPTRAEFQAMLRERHGLPPLPEGEEDPGVPLTSADLILPE